jgi:drug/metabolite transporter (DMT)-like permease
MQTDQRNPALIKLAPFALIMVSFVWGATFPWVKKALSDFSPLYWVAFRFMIAAILFGIFYFGKKSGKKEGIIQGSILGFVLGASFMMQTIGIKLSSAATMGLLTGLILPFIYVIETFIGKTRLERKVTASLGLAFLGFILLSWERGMNFHTADILGIVASFGFAMQIFLTGRYAARFEIANLNFYQMLAVSIMALISALVFEDFSALNFHSFPAISSIIFTALFCSFFAFMIQTWAQRFVSNAKTTLLFSLEPLFAALVSWSVYYNEVTFLKIFGAILMLSSVAIVQINKK